MSDVPTEEKTEFTFDELDDRAKQRAIEHYRNQENDDFDGESVIEGAVEALAKLGIEVDMRNVNAGKSLKVNGRFVKGVDGNFVPAKPVYKPDVNWDVGQGGGVSFDGWWRAADMNYAALMEDRPTDDVLRKCGARLLAVYLRYPDLRVQIKASGRGYGSTTELYDGHDGLAEDDEEALLNEIGNTIHALADWIHTDLENEYSYVYSDEYITERLEDDDQLYDEDGDEL